MTRIEAAWITTEYVNRDMFVSKYTMGDMNNKQQKTKVSIPIQYTHEEKWKEIRNYIPAIRHYMYCIGSNAESEEIISKEKHFFSSCVRSCVFIDLHSTELTIKKS